jgi:two-component system cell cycle sensor histidine kinase/response regulator CckA
MSGCFLTVQEENAATRALQAQILSLLWIKANTMQHLKSRIEELENEVTFLRQRVTELEASERKYVQAKKSLKTQRQRLFSLLNRLPAYVYLQAPDHTIRFANRYFRKHFGAPNGLKCHEVLRNRKTPCPECQTFQVFETKEPQRWEWNCSIDGLSYEVLDYPYVDLDGSLLVLELGLDVSDRKQIEDDLRSLQADLEKRVAERTEQLRDIVSKLLEEIAERKKTEEALRKSEERYALAVLGANDGIWDRDLDTGEVYFSPRWKGMLSYEDHELANDLSEWKSRIHTDDYERVTNTLQWYLGGHIPVYEVEYRLQAKDGSYRWIHSRGACLRDPWGNPYRIAGSHTDITYRKRIEVDLRESERKYRKIFEESRDVIFVFDADARLLDINPSAQELLGYTPEELFSLDIAREIYVDPEARERFHRSLFSDGFVKDLQVEMKRTDGEIVVVHISASVTRNEEGIITGYVGTIHDMTQHKKLEQQLLHVQKMESIGLLAGGIAHDFNNLLTAISGYGETIRENINRENPLLRSSVDQVLLAAERARELTHNLLAVSRKQIINPKPLLINTIITEIHSFISRIIGEDIELTTKSCKRKLPVVADRGQIEQVLINLATNSRDAMPTGGRLSISASHMTVTSKSKELIGIESPGEYAVIKVSDTGIGMMEKTRQKIFEPFFTTKEIGKGTGLGLSISYGIIKQHNGAISVESSPHAGAVFTIYLPLLQMDIETTPARKDMPVTPGTETILVAEDEEIVKHFLLGILQRAGYTVITAANGEEAISRFREHDSEISLVVSDVVMPKKNGREIYEEIRSLRPDIKFIFISGYTADIILKKGIVEEGIDFVTKPFSKNEILRKVRHVLDREET